MLYERLLQIARDYILNDLETADPDYVREILIDNFGCTEAELEELGLAFLIEEG